MMEGQSLLLGILRFPLLEGEMRFFCIVFMIMLGFIALAILSVWVSPQHENPLGVFVFGSLAISTVVIGVVYALAQGSDQNTEDSCSGNDA